MEQSCVKLLPGAGLIISPVEIDIHATFPIPIVTEIHPLQNADHCEYLLTALYFESLKLEPWEEDATEADRAEFVFEGDARAQHAEAIAAIMNQGETLESVEAYKERVTAAMGLKPL